MITSFANFIGFQISNCFKRFRNEVKLKRHYFFNEYEIETGDQRKAKNIDKPKKNISKKLRTNILNRAKCCLY